jgi:predicted Zn finger-like uncharacterized protein
MKIVCDSCGTKYSIADEKVRGKVFKIRCKKCSHIIVVRGGESAPEAAAPASDGGWHLVIDGEQVGPLSDADVRTKVERGEIKADTYTWKEGFADWVKLSAVPEFAGLVAGDEMAVAAGGELFTGSSAVAAPNGAERSRRASGAEPSLFGGGGASDVFASPAAAPSRGPDLFGSSSAVPTVDEGRWPSSGAASVGHDGGRVENLTGQRHENSVLFSLSNLQSLAMPSAAPKPSLGSTSATPEGSGLIDIRAMAASTLGTSNNDRVGAPLGNVSPPDDLPAFGSFSPAAPVLLPLPSSSGPPKWLYAAGALMLAALVGIGVMAWKVLSAKPPVLVETVQTVAAPAPPAPKAAPAEPTSKPSSIADDKLPPREGSAEATGAPVAKPEKSEHEHHHGHHGEHEVATKDTSKKGEKGGGAATTAAVAAPAEPAEKRPPKGSLDDLLDGAVRSRGGGGGKKVSSDDDGASKKPDASSTPLAKSAVVAGMNSVKPKVSACYNEFKQQGMAMVNVVIAKNGKVSSATVTGKFAGTPTGACVEKAVKSATFPPSEGLSTPYPFQLR